jgi:hypothetical protein
VSEDWSAIAAEVDEAIRSIADVGEPGGFPVALRKPGSPTGDPWNPTPGMPTYATLWGFEAVQELRDVNGTLIDQTKRTLTVSAQPGVVPDDEDSVLVGMNAEEAETAGDAAPWTSILIVRPLAPVGIAVLYEIDLVN